MAWRCRFFTARPSQDGRVIAEKGLSEEFARPTHWLVCTQVANYCLCQRCWPFGHAKSPFKTKEDYMDALLAHHAVMTAAMKAKQAVEPSASAALKHAVEDAVKMYVPL